MVICSFCGNEANAGTGVSFFKRDGTSRHFCSRKCEMNQFKLKRNPAHLKWTTKFASTAKKKK
ncbi:MAG: 50S ribosomal protein L24e [Candidatus Micrarchaeota archaeon]